MRAKAGGDRPHCFRSPDAWLALAEVAQVDHRVCQCFECIMELAETLEPEKQAAELILPTEHALNGVEPLLEDRGVEERPGAAFRRFPASRVRVDVWHHAAIENRLPVTPAIIDAGDTY